MIRILAALLCLFAVAVSSADVTFSTQSSCEKNLVPNRSFSQTVETIMKDTGASRDEVEVGLNTALAGIADYEKVPLSLIRERAIINNPTVTYDGTPTYRYTITHANTTAYALIQIHYKPLKVVEISALNASKRLMMRNEANKSMADTLANISYLTKMSISEVSSKLLKGLLDKRILPADIEYVKLDQELFPLDSSRLDDKIRVKIKKWNSSYYEFVEL